MWTYTYKLWLTKCCIRSMKHGRRDPWTLGWTQKRIAVDAIDRGVHWNKWKLKFIQWKGRIFSWQYPQLLLSKISPHVRGSRTWYRIYNKETYMNLSYHWRETWTSVPRARRPCRSAWPAFASAVGRSTETVPLPEDGSKFASYSWESRVHCWVVVAGSSEEIGCCSWC